MRRIVFLAVAALVAWLGLGIAGPVQAAAPVPVQIYAYDVHDTPAASVRTATERGPPATYDHGTADYAEDRLPLGTSARPSVTATPATCDYDDAARFAQTTRDSRAEGQVCNVAADAVVVDRSQVAANAAGDASTVLLRTQTQLQKKFKHAGDFGVSGNYSKANAAKFSSAMHQHMNAAGTQRIVGMYRNAPAAHYLDPKTGLNVVSDLDGNFITGFRLGSGQLNDVLTTGRLW